MGRKLKRVHGGKGATVSAVLALMLLVLALVFPSTGLGAGKGNPDVGEKIYRASCFACHGVDPAHDGPLGPAIQGSSRKLLQIRLEKGGASYPRGYKPKRTTAVMPPMANLLPRLDDLLAYLSKKYTRPTAKAKVAPATVSAASRGKSTYLSTCAGCHQPKGEGKAGLAPSLTDQDFLALVSDEFIRTTLKQGRPGTNMISFAFLKSNQVNDIIAYLRSFQHEKRRKFNRKWKASGNRKSGQQWYQAVCGQCHGVNGKGYLMGGSGTGIGLNGFLSVASDGYIKQVLRFGREGTPMRAFGGPNGLAQLPDQAMNDVIVYLRFLGRKNAK